MSQIPTSVTDQPECGPRRDSPRRLGGALRGKVAIGAVTVVGAILWFWQIGSKSLFLDEALPASTVLRPWRSLVSLTYVREADGLIHAFLLRALTVFGESEGVLRSLSALCLIALVPVVGAIGWRLASPRAGVLASLLLVVNGAVAAHAQYDRTYALSMLLAGLATLFFAMDVDEPRRATLVAWAAGCTLLTYSHILGVLLVACHLVSLWFLPAGHRLVRRRLGAGAIVGVAAIPLALLIYTHNERQFGVSRTRLGVYRDVLFTLTGRAGLIGLVAFAVMSYFVVRVTLRTWRAGRHSRKAWALGLLASWSVLPTVVLVVLSPFSPLSGRYLLFSLVGILIWGAVGLDDALGHTRGLTGWRRLAPLAVVLGAGVYGLAFWYSDGGEEDWRAASSYVFDEARPSDRILFANDSVRLFFEYYRRSDQAATLPEPVYPADPWGGYETGDQTFLSFDREDVSGLTADPTRRVWVVVGLHHVNTEHVPEVLAPLSARYQEIDRRVFKGGIEVVLLAPR